jgi:Flp pilus assembly protein TadG
VGRHHISLFGIISQRKAGSMGKASERGAVAVEFALLVPILVMILLGIMEFGRAYNVQTALTNAAREGVRAMAINNTQAGARTAVRNAATQLNPALADGNITFNPASCAVGSQMTVTVNYNLSTMTGIAGPFAMSGTGTMLCGG